jgi:two-component system, LytTR family, response regulator
MTPLRIAVADDEPLARQMVRRLLAGLPNVEVIVECASGDEVAAALDSKSIDVLLLDVRMPGRDVFDLLDERAHAAPHRMPAVVFTTAHERYAVRAFKVNAADYLVKPLDAARFREALQRAADRVTDRAASAAAVGQLARDLGHRPDRLLVPERGRMVPIAVSAIDWIQAEGDYTRLHAGGKSYLLARSLTDLERRLDADRFVRIHRSAIINLDRIKEVKPEGSRRHSVILADGTRLVLSRSRADHLKRWRV